MAGARFVLVTTELLVQLSELGPTLTQLLEQNNDPLRTKRTTTSFIEEKNCSQSIDLLLHTNVKSLLATTRSLLHRRDAYMHVTNLPATNTCPLMRASFFSHLSKSSWVATHLMSFRNSPTTFHHREMENRRSVRTLVKYESFLKCTQSLKDS